MAVCMGPYTAVKRSPSDSVLDLAIHCWNQEVDQIVMPITASTGANHNGVMGVLDHNVISTADMRLDAIRERVLARIWGKQRRLDTG